MDDPVGYFVEKYQESNNAFTGCRTSQIQRTELAKHWVNDRPLIRLVEDKLQEIVEKSRRQPAALVSW